MVEMPTTTVLNENLTVLDFGLQILDYSCRNLKYIYEGGLAYLISDSRNAYEVPILKKFVKLQLLVLYRKMLT